MARKCTICAHESRHQIDQAVMPLHSDGDELSVDEIMQEISITVSDDLLCRMNEGELTKLDILDRNMMN